MKRMTTNADKLFENERGFRSFFSQAPIGILVADENGVYLDANPKALEISGYSRQELVGKKITDLVPENHAAKAKDQIQQVFKSGQASEQGLFIHKDGSIKIWMVKAVKLTQKEFVGFVEDITERRQDEEALETRNRELERFNQAATGRELRMIELKKEVNELCRLTGRPERYAIPQPQVHKVV